MNSDIVSASAGHGHWAISSTLAAVRGRWLLGTLVASSAGLGLMGLGQHPESRYVVDPLDHAALPVGDEQLAQQAHLVPAERVR